MVPFTVLDQVTALKQQHKDLKEATLESLEEREEYEAASLMVQQARAKEEEENARAKKKAEGEEKKKARGEKKKSKSGKIWAPERGRLRRGHRHQQGSSDPPTEAARAAHQTERPTKPRYEHDDGSDFSDI